MFSCADRERAPVGRLKSSLDETRHFGGTVKSGATAFFVNFSSNPADSGVFSPQRYQLARPLLGVYAVMLPHLHHDSPTYNRNANVCSSGSYIRCGSRYGRLRIGRWERECNTSIPAFRMFSHIIVVAELHVCQHSCRPSSGLCRHIYLWQRPEFLSRLLGHVARRRSVSWLVTRNETMLARNACPLGRYRINIQQTHSYSRHPCAVTCGKSNESTGISSASKVAGRITNGSTTADIP